MIGGACFKQSCPAFAQHCVWLKVWANAAHKANHKLEPMLIATTLDVCARHKDEGLLLSEVLGHDDTWTKVENMFKAAGNKPPQRDLTELYYPAISDPLVQAWRSGLKREVG